MTVSFSGDPGAVDRVAHVLHLQHVEDERCTWEWVCEHWPNDAEVWRERARAAIDALGLREEALHSAPSRRWTLYDQSEDYHPLWTVGDGRETPAFEYAEAVEVMPVAEHEAVVQEWKDAYKEALSR